MEHIKDLAVAVVKLFHPLAEVVIHDVKSGKIKDIFGDLSNRQIGDDSLIDFATFDETDCYSKINFDGRLVKSISIPVKENEQLVALICINCDISIFEGMRELSLKMLAIKETSSQLFTLDWQEEVNKSIHAHIQQMKWNFENLNVAQKKELVKRLYDSHAFLNKNAADYVAKVLRMGRATIFNYLKTWKNHEAI